MSDFNEALNDELDDEVLESEESSVYKCPNCSGDMVYSPEVQNLHCQYCETVVDLGQQSVDALENSFEDYLEKGMKNHGLDGEKKIVNCESCGAELIFDKKVSAEFCSYCGSSHIVEVSGDDYINPDYLIPFKVSEKEGNDLFKKWIKKKFYAPKILKKTAKNNRLIGNYLPYWTYDANTYSVYRAQRGDYYYVTRTRVVDGKTQTYRQRRTRWRWVSGSYNDFHDDYLVNASRKENESIAKAIEPFDLKELVEYKKEYLSGFIAEKYSINLKDGWQIAKVMVDNDIETDVKRQIGGDVVRFLNIETSYSNVTFKHLYLPAWISSYKFKDKVYNFMINGQTGEVQGKYPKSILKIILTIMLASGFIYAGYILLEKYG